MTGKKVKKVKKLITGNTIRLVIFVLVIGVAVGVCAKMFTFTDAEHSNKIFEQFYAQDTNTVDCVYFGSSATQRGWVVPVAFHDEGVASYSLSCGTQPFVLTRYLMAEVQKTQDPRLFIVELRGVCKGPDDLWDVAVRRMLDNMKPSKNKYDAIQAVLNYASQGKNGIDESGLSYYFPLLKYHSLWNPSKKPHYGGVDYYKGYALEPKAVFRVTDIHPFKYNDDTIPLAPASEAALKDLLDYCDSIKAKVLFVISPYEASEGGMGKLNTAKNIVEERGYECLNFLPAKKREAIGLSDDTCYYNREHLNMYGSIKYTDYLSKYIKKHYNIPDRRNDSRYDSWNEEYERLTANLDGKYADLNKEMKEKIKKINKKNKKTKKK